MAEERPKLTADFGPEVGVITFQSSEELQTAINEEFQRFGMLASNQNIGNRYAEIKRQILRTMGQGIGGENELEWVNNALQAWAERYKPGENSLLHSRTAKGRFVIDLAKKDGTVAAGAASYFLGINFNSDNRPMAEGMVRGILFEKGLEGVEGAAKALAESQSEWNAFLAKMREQDEQHRGARANRLNEFNIASDKQLEDFAGANKKAMDEAAESLKAAQQRFVDLEKTYSDKLALDAPVSYWESRYKTHRQRSAVFGWTFGLALPIGALLLFELLQSILQSEHPPAWQIGMAVTVGTFVVWGIRVLAKLLFLNVQLATDAKERATLITTYLAMLKHSESMKPEDRHLVLKPLFARSAAAGGAADDLSPNLLQDLVSKLKGE